MRDVAASDRRSDLRKDPRRARRVLDPHRLRHGQRPGRQHPVCADGRRLPTATTRRPWYVPTSRCCRRRGARTAASWPTSVSSAAIPRSTSRKSPPARAKSWPASRASTAPRASRPDGRKLAMTLSKSGNPEIYVMDLASRNADPDHQPLRHRYRADLDADGQPVYFTSDRAGKPQIYQVPAAGGERHPRQLPGQLQRQGHGVLRRQEAGHGAGQRKRVSYRGSRPQPRFAALVRCFRRVRSTNRPASHRTPACCCTPATEGRRGVLYAVFRRRSRAPAVWCWPMATCASPPGRRSAALTQAPACAILQPNSIHSPP